jgi:hypothetical protein
MQTVCKIMINGAYSDASSVIQFMNFTSFIRLCSLFKGLILL